MHTQRPDPRPIYAFAVVFKTPDELALVDAILRWK